MARSKYIYLIRGNRHKNLLGCFTVKHDAVIWVALKGWYTDDLELSRMKDGLDLKCPIGKHEEPIAWPKL